MLRLGAPQFAVVLGVCMSGTTLRAAIVFQDNFGPPDAPGPNVTLANWTVIKSPTYGYTGQVDLVGGSFFGNTICTVGDSIHGSTGAGGTDPCVDLAGSGPLPSGADLVSELLTFDAGTTYSFSFELAGSQRGNQNTVVTGFYDTSYNILASQTFNNIPTTQQFTAESVIFAPKTTITGYVFFDNSSNMQTGSCVGIAGNVSCGYMGALVEDVVVQTVPETATGVFVGFGVLGLGTCAARRRTMAAGARK